MTAPKADPRVDKRRVTMTNWTGGPNGEPVPHSVDDYVRPDFLDAYVADARTRWSSVVVSQDPDAGPAGYHGPTHVPAHLNHPLAGQSFEATTDEEN